MKTLKTLSIFGTLIPLLVLIILFQQIHLINKLILLYLTIGNGIYLYSFLGKNRGKLFELPKLIFLFSIFLIASTFLAFLTQLSENMAFTESFFITSIILYAILFLFLTINLKK